MTCVVCFYPDDVTNLPCCSSQVCDLCLKRHVSTQLGEGNVIIKCPGFRCSKTLNQQLMKRAMTNSMEARHMVLKVNAKKDPTVKVCPRCDFITTRTKQELRKMKSGAGLVENPNSKVRCERCSYDWCFYCYGPWHLDTSCKGNKNDRSTNTVSEWSKKQTTSRQQRNAFPCPYCGIYIERSGGCPNMVCTRCRTNWCYLCGKQTHLFIPLIGHHEDKYSVLGCTSDWKLIGGNLEKTKKIRRGILITHIVLIVLIAIPFSLLIIPLIPSVMIICGTFLISIACNKLMNKLKNRWNNRQY